jgi:hypothetical protein
MLPQAILRVRFVENLNGIRKIQRLRPSRWSCAVSLPDLSALFSARGQLDATEIVLVQQLLHQVQSRKATQDMEGREMAKSKKLAPAKKLEKKTTLTVR